MMMKFKIILTSLVMASLLSCGQHEAPHSKTLDYQSMERQLYVAPGEGGGYCVYDRHRSGKVRLVTARGALSAEQLGQSLSYMSYWSQAASSALPTASWGYVSVRFLQQKTGIFEQSMADKAISNAGKSKFLRVTIRGLLLFGAAHMVNGLYRIIKGNYEGERSGAIAAQFFFGWMPFNFLVEDMQRRGRVETLASEYEQQGISERKINRIIEKLGKKKPAFPDACQQVGMK